MTKNRSKKIIIGISHHILFFIRKSKRLKITVNLVFNDIKKFFTILQKINF